MNSELFYLVLVTAFTGLMWVPYILDRIGCLGLGTVVGYPDNPPAQSAWAQRLMKAHANAVENLVIFGVLVLIAHVLEVTAAAVSTAAMVYFWARVVHALSYTFAIPWIRTLAFAVGFFCQAVIAWQILIA